MTGSRRGASGNTEAVVDEAVAEYQTQFPEPRWQEYLHFHKRRYRVLAALVAELMSKSPAAEDGIARILDIGPRFEVDLLHRIVPGVPIDTIGLNTGVFPPRDGERQLLFDLNEGDDAARWPSLGPYWVIVMAEVLEHLYRPPSVIFPRIAPLLAPRGYLIVQTPNAVALPMRLKMLAGKNPFGQLSTDRAYPGHIREYTTAELARDGQASGLEVVELRTANYFASGKPINRLFQRLEQFVPPTLRSGITVVYRARLTATT
jgi:hypothetical protein